MPDFRNGRLNEFGNTGFHRLFQAGGGGRKGLFGNLLHLAHAHFD